MYLLAITLLITNAVISHGTDYKKCCKAGEYLSEISSSYECVENKLARLDVLTNETNFLQEKTDGECAEVSTDFFVFNVTNGQIVGKRPVSEAYFPKCCPLNYFYNSVKHSCDERSSLSLGLEYVQGHFVKVGLPNCKLIVDYQLNVTINYDYSLLDAPKKKLEDNSGHYLGSYCIDENEKGSLVMRKCKESLEICKDIKCVKKCCPDGQSFIDGAKCFDTYTHGLNLSSFTSVEKPEDSYAIIYKRTCPRLYMMKEDKYTFNLNDQGVFKNWVNKSGSFVYYDVGNMNSYCIEHTQKKNIEGYFFFMCFRENQVQEKFIITAWPKILSCICLVLTIFVYLILKETRKVFGKILVNYCVALFFENAVLTYVQMNIHTNQFDCRVRSFSVIFFATAAFSWSNVMCCDIWWTFGSAKRTVGAQQRKRELKKLFLYFLYGWGVPTVLTLIILLFYTYRVLPYSIQPIMAITKCFFERRKGNYAHAFFFNLPHLIIQLINMVLFTKTIVYCLKVKNEINRVNDTTKDDKHKRFQKDKERLFLILKLSVIMGVSFIFEVVSAFFEMSKMGEVPKYIEIVWDTINCLQGVFIFVIFICKRKVYRDFLLKIKLLESKNVSTSSLHTQSTITSNGTSMKVFNPLYENGKIT